MSLIGKISAAMAEAAPRRLALPEHRQIELYTRRKSLEFEAPDEDRVPYAQLAGVVGAFHRLETLLAARHFDGEPRPSWAFYTALPRDTPGDKLASQLYRILRIVKLVLFDPHGHVDLDDGIVKIGAVIGGAVLTLDMTPAGLTLLESAVAFIAAHERSPYPKPYVEALLAEYFLDIGAEIKRYSDEGRNLYQFRRVRPFSRHFRFDCDNPKFAFDGDHAVFDIGPLYRDAARYPIDLFVVIGAALHIVPVEALSEGRIARADLGKWRARLSDGERLPAEFRARFAREAIAVNQPMT